MYSIKATKTKETTRFDFDIKKDNSNKSPKYTEIVREDKNLVQHVKNKYSNLK
jgi:hypothetical protein